ALPRVFPAPPGETGFQHGGWTRLDRGIYATGSGPPSRKALLWAALLWAGSGAVLSHETAAELWGLIRPPGHPRDRPARPQPGPGRGHGRGGGAPVGSRWPGRAPGPGAAADRDRRH